MLDKASLKEIEKVADRKPVKIKELPSGYDVIHHHDNDYYYYHGVYYVLGPYGWYTACHPPYGLRIRHLPYGYISFVYLDVSYYYYYDTYYIYDEVERVYVVTEEPETDTIETHGSVMNGELPVSKFDRITLIDGSSIEGEYIGGNPECIYMEVISDTIAVAIENVLSLSIAPALGE